ncbi:MAG: ribosome biogenesis GTPase YlqF [Clostridiales bacterium]|nr:ribosome biogenesis GTPase YlqF [Clostridiales bacterium]
MNEKLQVQWFPGHMAKTRRLIKESLAMVDAVCEIVDARLPLSSRNPEIDDITGSKPRIILLNKCDLADEKATERFVDYFKNSGFTALPVDCRNGRGLNAFRPAAKNVLRDRIAANEKKGMGGKPLRIMVVGIPNTGKSSFINRMAGKNKAEVADKPGVTRSNRWFNIGDGMELLDTPGVLWPKFEDPEVGDKLSFIGSVKDTVLDIEEIAVRFVSIMQKKYPALLSDRYALADFAEKEPFEVIEMIAAKRGMLLRGGEFDTQRASVMLLDEYRSGKLGRLTLD